MESKKDCWEFHEHTADAKYTAYGASLQECFRNAGRACFAVITDVDAVKTAKRTPVKKTAKNLEALLFDYLDELLFLLDTEGFLVHDVEDLDLAREENGDWSIHCTVVGDEHKAYDVSGNVKAVTYNEMKIEGPEQTGIIEGEPRAWQATIVVDL